MKELSKPDETILRLCDECNHSAEAQATINQFAVKNSLGDSNTAAVDIVRRVREFIDSKMK